MSEILDYSSSLAILIPFLSLYALRCITEDT